LVRTGEEDADELLQISPCWSMAAHVLVRRRVAGWPHSDRLRPRVQRDALVAGA